MKQAMPTCVALWILAIFSLVPLLNAPGAPGAIAYSVPGMDKAEVRTNLVYKKDGSDEIKSFSENNEIRISKTANSWLGIWILQYSPVLTCD